MLISNIWKLIEDFKRIEEKDRKWKESRHIIEDETPVLYPGMKNYHIQVSEEIKIIDELENL